MNQTNPVPERLNGGFRKAVLVVATACFATAPVTGAVQAGGQGALVRQIGAVKNVSATTLTLTPASGPDVVVTVLPNARLLRIAPGAKDLKDAAVIQLQDLQVGDRVRVRGQAAADGSIAALEILAMARTDIDARHQQEQQDWQKRGVGGLVGSVDPASGTVTVSVSGLGGKKSIAVHTSHDTVIRRYAPDSVKFDDAKPGSLADIHPGDQLRARGARSADGLELQAEEIVTGSFRNIAGTVNSVDASASTVTVQDLLTKKPVVVRIAADSQLHKLPEELAQRIAARLKGSMPAGIPGAGGSSAAAARPAAEGGNAPRPGGPPATGAGNGAGPGSTTRPGGAPDFQQILSRMPSVSLSDLRKGDAVLIVATEGVATGGTAITLLTGVEPILQAAPSGSQAMMLTPWSLGGAPGGEGLQ